VAGNRARCGRVAYLLGGRRLTQLGPPVGIEASHRLRPDAGPRAASPRGLVGRRFASLGSTFPNLRVGRCRLAPRSGRRSDLVRVVVRVFPIFEFGGVGSVAVRNQLVAGIIEFLSDCDLRIYLLPWIPSLQIPVRKHFPNSAARYSLQGAVGDFPIERAERLLLRRRLAEDAVHFLLDSGSRLLVKRVICRPPAAVFKFLFERLHVTLELLVLAEIRLVESRLEFGTAGLDFSAILLVELKLQLLSPGRARGFDATQVVRLIDAGHLDGRIRPQSVSALQLADVMRAVSLGFFELRPPIGVALPKAFVQLRGVEIDSFFLNPDLRVGLVGLKLLRQREFDVLAALEVRG